MSPRQATRDRVRGRFTGASVDRGPGGVRSTERGRLVSGTQVREPATGTITDVTTNGTPKRAAIYARISHDREGESLGVTRQEDDARELAERLGYEVVELYVDNDRSASTRTRKVRPEYDRMLAAARAGRFDAVLAYSNSRLTRRPREVEDLIELHERHGIRLHTVVSGDDDLSTADGRMIARIKGSVDASDAERTAERVARAARQAAESGRWHGGPRPFGYESDGVTVREPEAEAIREAYRIVLAGGSVRSVMLDWNSRGLRTGRSGRAWTLGGVRDVLCNPRYAGKRAYRGEVVADAEWPAVVDLTTWEAVRAMLKDPSRRHGPKSARRLLTGIATCGVCGHRVHCTGSTADNHLYRCAGSQGHVARRGTPIDELVEAVVVARLSEPDAAYLAKPAADEDDLDEVRQEVSALRARLDQLATDFADGDLTASQLRSATKRLRERIDTGEQRLAAGSRDDVLRPLVDTDDVAAVWSTLDTDRKRAVIDTLVTVTILPTGRGVRTFRPETVKIGWKK